MQLIRPGFLFTFAAILILFFACSKTTTPANEEIQDQPSANVSVQYPLAEIEILQAFANRSGGFNGKYHTAEDYAGTPGTPVYAMADGTISFSGPMGGYGWLITVFHADLGVYTLYGHLSTERDKVLSGSVKKGDIIAYLADDDEDGSGPIGGGGNGYPYWGPHLHFGVRTGNITNYSSADEDRWMAGYTIQDPTLHNWLHPTEYIQTQNEENDGSN